MASDLRFRPALGYDARLSFLSFSCFAAALKRNQPLADSKPQAQSSDTVHTDEMGRMMGDTPKDLSLMASTGNIVKEGDTVDAGTIDNIEHCDDAFTVVPNGLPAKKSFPRS